MGAARSHPVSRCSPGVSIGVGVQQGRCLDLGRARSRYQAELWLTAAEARRFERLAEADLRTVDNFITKLVVDELCSDRVRQNGPIESRGRRSIYSVRLWLSAAEKRKLERRAEAAEVSMGGYVRGLVRGMLRR